MAEEILVCISGLHTEFASVMPGELVYASSDIAKALPDNFAPVVVRDFSKDRPPEEPEPEAAPEPEAEDVALSTLTKAELQAELEARDLPTSGNKDELIERLEEAE